MSGRRDRILDLIALFKLFKALCLIALGLGVLTLLEPGAAERAQHWVDDMTAIPNRRAVQHLLGQAGGLSRSWLEAVGVGALVYAGLFVAEGVGLWLEKRWAEYLTVIATASFIPFEIFELMRRPSPLRLAALVVNLAVVAYLVYRLRHPRGRQLPLRK